MTARRTAAGTTLSTERTTESTLIRHPAGRTGQRLPSTDRPRVPRTAKSTLVTAAKRTLATRGTTRTRTTESALFSRATRRGAQRIAAHRAGATGTAQRTLTACGRTGARTAERTLIGHATERGA
ncbi:hypothetical protein SAMN04489713_13311 [Actinomadura madurae]|uniref:Uncharacterized protein n=1 Tax=Actinomadura madurae TaxID=1993 RepID=A0A1I5YIA3_9ACTN|nr:hypothetical protein SAMN04489713_13311 [Actinomadura madurae]